MAFDVCLKRWRSLGGVALLVSALGWASPAGAANVLVVGPLPERALSGVDISANLMAELSGQSVTYIDGTIAGSVTSSTFTQATPYDLVIVLQPQGGPETPNMEAGNLTAIMAAIQDKQAKAFTFFADSGGTGFDTGVPNLAPMNDLVTRLNTVGGLGLSVGALDNGAGNGSGDHRLPLTTHAPYATSSFAGWNPIHGGFFNYLNGVPVANALYVSDVTTLPVNADSARRDNVYAAIVPYAQSYGGDGACVIGFVDLTLFEARNNAYADNAGKIAPALLGAVAAACGAKVDLVPTVSGPAVLPVGSSANYTLKVTNEGTLAATNGTVRVTLPPGLALPATVPLDCVRDSDTQMSCDLALLAPPPVGLAPKASVSLSLELTATAPLATGAEIAASVSGVLNEAIIDQGNNKSSLRVVNAAAAGGSGVAAVPTMSQWTLLLTGLLAAGLGGRRLRGRH